MLELTERGRAVEMFRAVDERVPPGPPDVPAVLGVPAQHGVTVQGPDGA
ncbi:hypothetical protein [Halomonas nitroreducens]|nr:hypothetical protein [Halomonas nitroreducens]